MVTMVVMVMSRAADMMRMKTKMTIAMMKTTSAMRSR